MENDIHEGDDIIIAGKVKVVMEGAFHTYYRIQMPSGDKILVTEKDIKSYRPEVKVDGEDHRKGN
jgi:hypothetical protein